MCGIGIEKATEEDPDSVIKVPLLYVNGISGVGQVEITKTLDITTFPDMKSLSSLLIRLYSLLKATDATLLEINPFVKTINGEFMCFESKSRLTMLQPLDSSTSVQQRD
jgi:succinyl-CoA synthetase beta subunit